jgi:hypothetical protein
MYLVYHNITSLAYAYIKSCDECDDGGRGDSDESDANDES